MAIFEHTFDFSVRDVNEKTELTNKAMLGFFEDIGGYQSDIAGYGLKDIETTKLSWILLHWKIKVLKRIKYGDSIHVKTWSRGAKRACCYRDFEIYNQKGELCTIATSKWALIHLEKGLMRITDELVEKYQTEPKQVFGAFDFEKLKEPETSKLTFEYQLQRRDIDINQHMHNLCYLDLAYEALPKEIYEANSFDNIEIMYKSGAYLGDTVSCFYSKQEDEHIIAIKSQDETTLHAIVKLS